MCMSYVGTLHVQQFISKKHATAMHVYELCRRQQLQAILTWEALSML